jgi:hypothetical protein
LYYYQTVIKAEIRIPGPIAAHEWDTLKRAAQKQKNGIDI